MSSLEHGGPVVVAAVDPDKMEIDSSNNDEAALCEKVTAIQDESENGNASTSTNTAADGLSKSNEIVSPRRSYLEAKSSGKELLVSTDLVQSRHKWIDERNNSVQRSVCSPTNSICSQSTALSRARTDIEGRRKSRAAARARMNAALDEVQSSKTIAREAAKERAWATLAEIQRSRSFSSRNGSNDEDEETRQPTSAALSTLHQVQQDREEIEEDIVGKVLTPETGGKSKRSGRPRNPATARKDNVRADEKKTNEPASKFVLSDEALLAVSQAALGSLQVDPKIGYAIPSPEKRNDMQIANNAASTMSSKSSKETDQSESNSSYMLRDQGGIALGQVALDMPPKNEKIQSPKKETASRGRARNRESEPRRSSGDAASVREILSMKDSESTVPARNVTIDSEQKQNSSAGSKPQNSDKPLVEVAESEDSYDVSLSSSSSEDNSKDKMLDIKPVDTDDSVGGGAVDKLMYQGKSFEPKSIPASLDMGSTNNSEDSEHSSDSSERSRMPSPNKSMGPIWQRAIDDAQAQHPKSPKTDLEDNVADDETVYTVRTSFNIERLKYAASFGVFFLLMNSLFVTLDESSFAIRVFGLIGLISGTFPLMVIGMYLLSSKTQANFWTCSVKMLLLGCLCQCCTLILFIMGLDLRAGAWAAGIISLACLLALTVEMNTNYPLHLPTKPGEAESSHLIVGNLWKCLVQFGLSPVDEERETKRRRSRRKKNKKSRLLDEVLDEQETREGVYSAPEIV